MRLLLAEDERDLSRILARKLTEEGYGVDCAYDGAEALELMAAAEYDGVILDVMMPRIDGFEVLRRMRGRGIGAPVLFLTARDAVADRVRGLDLGAEDYLVKPFSMAELLARVRALVRHPFGARTSVLTAGDLSVDLASHTVCRGGREIKLSAREYALLTYLLINKNVVLSRETIEDHVWNFDYEGGTNVVDVYISYLRKKIDEGYGNKLIRTVRGSGYVLQWKETEQKP
ncbi:MAG: response regulator transcription factor [Oscillospiraceae bacterium]|nr:response regulator transcription factor [Oscillospiraceae bacterium]